ncbi:MAG: hypothetical protein ACO36I_18610, partial [Candidatus Latescibacterota bacterium]
MNNIFFILYGILLVWFVPAQAHNGAIAQVVPVAGIVVDGNLSDWPPHVPRYAIALAEYGDAPKDSVDFQASFRIGFEADKKQVYIAVEVQDDDLIIDRRGPFQDGCEILLDVTHRDRSDPVQLFLLTGHKPVNQLPRRVIADWSQVQYAVKTLSNGYVYEWRLDVGAMLDSDEEA